MPVWDPVIEWARHLRARRAVRRGIRHLERNDSTAAMREFRFALDLDPTSATAWRYLSEALSEMQRPEAARQSRDRARFWSNGHG